MTSRRTPGTPTRAPRRTSAAPKSRAGRASDSGNDVFKDSGYPTITKQRDAKFPNVIGGNTYTMVGKMHMRCNEPKKNDNGKKYFLIALGAGAIGALISSLI